jgi:DNA-binding transcriptional regulator YdaS (Cro superfamily)
MIICETAGAAIDAVGGPTELGRLIGINPNRVSDWRKRGFPSHKLLVVTEALRSRGIEVLPSAFGMELPPPELRAAS